jgi:hopene-associated glycosyltransferase HpnB
VLILGIACAVSALAWAYLLLFNGGYWLTGQRLPPAGPVAHWPAVQAVVPARNEADMLPATLPALLGQDYPGELRVTLVDDGSSDGTGAIAAEIGRTRPGTALAVIPGRPRPDGWAGKVWAMQQGLEASGPGEGYLLFTDADIEWAPGALRALVAAAESDDRALVSQMALLSTRTRWERVIVPAFVYFFFQLYPPRRVNDPGSRVAAGAGGVMLIRRAALEKAGGLVRMKGALIDDVALGTLLKRDGNRCWLGLTRDIASIRPYPGLASLWHMIARSAYVQLRYSPLLLAGTVAGLAFLFALPLAGLLAAVASAGTGAGGAAGGGAGGGAGTALAGAAGLAALVLMAASFVPMLRYYHLSPLRAPLLPFIALLYAGMTVDSARRHYSGRAVSWRGRPAARTPRIQG